MGQLLVKGAFLLALLGLGLQAHSLNAQEPPLPHGTGKTTDNFFGFARFVTTPVFVCENSAVSLLAEAGPKNYRVNGTWGFSCQNQQRFKIGAEYLVQKLHYNYGTGKVSHWTRQWAVGANYQYLFNDCCDPCSCDPCSCCCNWIQGIQLNGAVSNADRDHLHVIIPDDPPFVSRNISGSWFVNGDIGVILKPWECGTLIVGIGYDWVRYNRNITGINENRRGHKNVAGVGGSVEFNQKFCGCYGFHLLAEFKRPYNYLEALVDWTKRMECGDLSVGLFGAHTWGKCNLASSSAAGVELRFAFGIDNCFNSVWCDPCSDPCDCCNPCQYSELSDWVSSPAVYMPEVLNIPNQLVESSA